MPSRTHKNHHEIVFFLLAIVIVMVGYNLLTHNSSFLDSAAVAKTGKTYTTPDKETTPSNTSNTSSSSSGSTASYQQNTSNAYAQSSNPMFYSSNTSNTQNNQTTAESLNTSSAQQSSQDETAVLVEDETISSQSTAQNHTINTFTSTNNDKSAEPLRAPVSETTPSLSISTAEIQSDSITLIINNPTSIPIEVEPIIEETPATLPNEQRVKELLAEELGQEGQPVTASSIEHQWQMLQLLEKEKVKPIYTHKVFHPWDFMTTNAITSLTYTSKRSSGALLELPAPPSFTVPALEQRRQDIPFPSAVSAVSRQVKLKLMVEGKEKYSTDFTVPASFSAAVGIDRKNNFLDVYLSIPQTIDTAEHEYFLEIQIKNQQGTAYYELFGPYHVAGTESALFSQEFEYDPRIVQGKEIVTLTIFKDGQEVKKREQEEDFS